MKRLPKASKNVLERFIATNASYIEATANEARLRAHGEVMSIEEYIPHRRENGGVRPCFDLIELVLGVELPEEVLKDHDFINAQNAAIDMIGWANVCGFSITLFWIFRTDWINRVFFTYRTSTPMPSSMLVVSRVIIRSQCLWNPKD